MSSSESTVQSRLVAFNEYRNQANKLFNKGSFEEALSEYKDIADKIKSLIDTLPLKARNEHMVDCMMVMVPAQLNRGLCLIKLERYQEASNLMDQILGYSTMYMKRVQHAKALYRKGFALEKMGHTGPASKCYESASKIAPDDKSIRDAVERIKVAPEDIRETEEFMQSGKLPSYVQNLSNAQASTAIPGLAKALRDSGLSMSNFGVNMNG